MGASLLLTLAMYVAIPILSLLTPAFATPIEPRDFSNDTASLRIVSREEWKAREPVARQHLEVSPTAYVVVHHGGIPKYCYTQKECAAIARSYQDLHLDVRGWYDIGYSFVIGEDGNAYEGRGWDYVGAHAPGYNTQSIGICVMGDFSDFLPNKAALKALNGLIEYGVSIGKIRPDYKLIGHRQARNTLCPGEEFYTYVKKLPHWTADPVPIYSTATTTGPPVVPLENAVEVNGKT